MPSPEQFRAELQQRSITSIKDYIEKDIVLKASVSMREIDYIVLLDGSRILGMDIEHCFPEVFTVSSKVTGEISYISYSSILKTVGTDKS